MPENRVENDEPRGGIRVQTHVSDTEMMASLRRVPEIVASRVADAVYNEIMRRIDINIVLKEGKDA